MRFELISLAEASRRLITPFSLLELTSLDNYSCSLFLCQGEIALHRHLDYDELFWPQDRDIVILGEKGPLRVRAGELARVPRGWKHGSTSETPAYVLLFNRGEHTFSLNGYPRADPPLPPDVADPRLALQSAPDNVPQPLLHCDDLYCYAERISGTGPGRRAIADVLVCPTAGSAGLRCGGIVVIVAPGEVARVPAGSGWHLFGAAEVVWMTKERAGN